MIQMWHTRVGSISEAIWASDDRHKFENVFDILDVEMDEWVTRGQGFPSELECYTSVPALATFCLPRRTFRRLHESFPEAI